MDSILHEIDIQPTDHVVFIHIAKTAGTTFNAILEPVMCGMPAYPSYQLMPLLYTELEDLRKYHFFSGHFPYKIFEYIFPQGFIGLTFLREPISRTISNFNFFQQILKRDSTPELSEYADELEQVKKLSLLALLENSHLRFTRNFTNIQTCFVGASGRFQAETKEMPGGFGKRRTKINPRDIEATPLGLDLAKRRLIETAFFGITERFQDSLFLLSYTFGWRPTLNKIHLNPTSERSDKIQLDVDTLAIIREKTTLDLELYAFGQDLFEKRFNEMTQTLLQRYGTKEQTALSLPLPTDVMMQLLEQHFLMRRDRRYQCAATTVGDLYEYTPSMHVEGSFGWYPLEDLSDFGPVRWSGPGLQSGFDLPCPSGENIQISFCILLALLSDIMDSVSVTANNIPVRLMREFQLDGSYIFTGNIPHQAIVGPFIRVVFSVSETIAPCVVDLSNGDTRPLGILLNWVKLAVVKHDELANNTDTYDYLLSTPFERSFGWYALENSEQHGAVRWSGPGLQSGFNLPCPLWRPIRISFCILMVLQPNILDELSITINDIPVTLTYNRQPDGSCIFTGEMIPSHAINGLFVRLVFSVPQIVSPSALDPSNHDMRELGILLNWVKLHKF